jgi:hypothetical protein
MAANGCTQAGVRIRAAQPPRKADHKQPSTQQVNFRTSLDPNSLPRDLLEQEFKRVNERKLTAAR